MPSCLGIYIEPNLIKYAKVSKNNDALKVESFGVKFFDNINIAIKQIIDETYSFKVPISINTADEIYNELEVFSLLSKKDMDDVIKTEFESICFEKEISRNAFEERHLLANADESTQKIKVIHIALPKTAIEQRKNQLLDCKLNNMMPTSIAVANLLNKDKKGTNLIVNIENNTTITKVKNSVISNVSLLNIGSKEILNNINRKENSYSKAYEICKNSTIYTDTDRDLQYEDNEYLEDIMPTLFQIVSEVRRVIDESVETIDKLYITGTGAIINNIDIYFQDYLKNTTCEILRPNFVNNNSKINIKDYIEVNTAIALAVTSLEKDSIVVDFLKGKNSNSLWEMLNSDVSVTGGPLEIFKGFNEFLIKYSKQYATVCSNLFIISVIYCLFGYVINNQMENKMAKVEESIANTEMKIEQVQENDEKFNFLKSKYQTLINNIQEINNSNSEDRRFRNSIPNLLNYIMVIIPSNVQLSSIENTTDTHIVIKAKSNNYDEIAFFKTALKTEGILKNVVSDTGTTKNGYLSVTIEGELP